MPMGGRRVNVSGRGSTLVGVELDWRRFWPKFERGRASLFVATAYHDLSSVRHNTLLPNPHPWKPLSPKKKLQCLPASMIFVWETITAAVSPRHYRLIATVRGVKF